MHHSLEPSEPIALHEAMATEAMAARFPIGLSSVTQHSVSAQSAPDVQACPSVEGLVCDTWGSHVPRQQNIGLIYNQRE